MNKRTSWAVGLAVVGVLLGTGAYVVGASAAPATGVVGTASPVSGAAAAPTTVPRTPMDDFILEIDSHTEMSWDEERSKKLNLGWAICADMHKKSREQMILTMVLPPHPWKREHAIVVIDSATRHLCPSKSWGSALVQPSPSAPPAPNLSPSSEEAANQSHFAIYTDGLYQVTAQNGGPDRVQPGRYRTSGPSALGGAMGCYWRKLDQATRETVPGQSNYTHGPDTVTLNEGDWFETSGCSSWAIQR